MSTIDERAAMVLLHERRFAEALAARVIDRPTVSVWMILIPILFVYHLYRHTRYVEGRKQFVEHYLKTRTSAVKEAAAALADRRTPETHRLAAENGLPADLQTLLAEVLEVLVEHYQALLQATGDDLDALIRSAYGSGTAYLLAMNRLNAAERRLYDALGPRLHGQPQQDEVGSMVASIEAESERLRREEAARIF